MKSPYDRIVGLLETNDITYEELSHEPVYTSEQAASVRGLSMDAGAKSLLLKAEDSFALVVLSGSRKLSSKKFKKRLGIRNLRFATPEEVRERMDCEVGSCYPFGSIVDLDTYLDASLLAQTDISFNPGVHDKSLVIKLKDYLTLENPVQVDVAN
jgi:prolyl-tRNA editing enzyme YbaK/EbsC (Cys-tRNA(Pro) deacylase)